MRHDNRIRGFTLIELMICVAILGIFVVGFNTVATATQATIADLGDQHAAIGLASDVLEDIRAAPFAERERAADQWRKRTDIAQPPAARVVVQFKNVRRGIVEVITTVEWKSSSGARRSVRLSTARGDY